MFRARAPRRPRTRCAARAVMPDNARRSSTHSRKKRTRALVACCNRLEPRERPRRTLQLERVLVCAWRRQLSKPPDPVKRGALLAGLYAIQELNERGASRGNGPRGASHLEKICAAWRFHDGAQERVVLLGG